jgi:quercetin dioxygenase-like cupin family protein
MNVNKHGFIVRPESLNTYCPPGHKSTVNRKLIGCDTVGAKKLEVILGEVESAGLAETHYHDVAEQAVYLLEGRCLIELEGEKQEMKPGDAAFFPPGKRHRVVPIGGPIKILVIYSPPLADVATGFKT